MDRPKAKPSVSAEHFVRSAAVVQPSCPQKPKNEVVGPEKRWTGIPLPWDFPRGTVFSPCSVCESQHGMAGY